MKNPFYVTNVFCLFIFGSSTQLGEILVPRLETEPKALRWTCPVLTTGPPRNFLDKCWRFIITSSNIIKINVHSWDYEITFSCKVLKNLEFKKVELFWEFYLAVGHLQSFPHLPKSSSFLISEAANWWQHVCSLMSGGLWDAQTVLQAASTKWSEPAQEIKSIYHPGLRLLFLFSFLFMACHQLKSLLDQSK